MPDSIDLLGLARLLSTAGGRTSATEVELRRAVSSVYYAVFHKVSDARHLADYDPTARFLASDVSSLIDQADSASGRATGRRRRNGPMFSPS